MRQEVEYLKNELAALQSFAMEHDKQITQLSLATDTNLDNTIEEDVEEEDVEEVSNEIVGTDLKELIEKELNI